jgi:phage FluMu protein Com
MPIRFRCQHCQQLMGIARRKSGTEVQCPTCRQMVLVPKDEDIAEDTARAVEPAAAPANKDAPAGKAAPLFERNDFDEVLRGTEEAPKSPKLARPVAPPRQDRSLAAAAGRVPSYDVEPVSGNAPMSNPAFAVPNGIFISSTRLTVIAVVGIILLAVAFGAGLLVGRYCL